MHFFPYNTSSISKALLRFLSDCRDIFMANSCGQTHCSFLATVVRTLAISSWEGAGTRIPRQRERTGSMTLDAELHIKIMRH
jgi:hypothetical protein